MLSLQRFQGVAWTLLGFMLVAAVVLNLRYKALDDGTAYLDTWTGEIRSTADLGQGEDGRLQVQVPNAVVIPESFRIVVPDPVVLRKKIEICVGEPAAARAPGRLESRAWSELRARDLDAHLQRTEGSSVRFAFPAPPHVCH